MERIISYKEEILLREELSCPLVYIIVVSIFLVKNKFNENLVKEN